MDLDGAQVRARRFVEERDWVRYQTPKNLAQALAGEVGERPRSSSGSPKRSRVG